MRLLPAIESNLQKRLKLVEVVSLLEALVHDT